MAQPRKQYERFKHGSSWLKADFHLHTRADKEFTYAGEENAFTGQYVERLKEQGIAVGVITNHNKFDKAEFDSLRKKARKEEILLLPGVELSVNDGANGVHVLVVFSPQWLENGNDYINSAISPMFPGKSKAEYEQENGRSDKNILSVVEELDKVGRDYFLVFAHVEQRSGLWQEMSGGKIGDFKSNRYAAVRQRTLAFQKVRSRDEREKVKEWLGDWYPAEVEGSDAKSIEEIGSKQGETWLKLGDFTFEAVKYALADSDHRLSSQQPEKLQHSAVKSIRFEGGALDGQRVCFSAELNTLIGVRGSGKSSLLEALRYALDIPFADKAIDKRYKEDLIAHTLGSGGKIVLEAVDRHGQNYTVSRRLNDLPEVFVGGQLQPGIAIRETVINKPIYFGQKDLSSTGEDFEKGLVEKLMGDSLVDIREKIRGQQTKVEGLVQQLMRLRDIAEKTSETRDKKQDAEFRLKIYKDNGIHEKLKKQTDFDTDQRRIEKAIADVRGFERGIDDLLDQFDDELKNHLLNQSKQNAEFFADFFLCYQSVLDSFEAVKKSRLSIVAALQLLETKQSDFSQLKQQQLDAFAETRQQLDAELKQQGKTLNLEEFPELQSRIETSTQLLAAYDKESQKKTEIAQELFTALSDLNELWSQEFRSTKTVLDAINDSQGALNISCEFKAEKAKFLEEFRRVFKGSGVRESRMKSLVDEYNGFIEIRKNWKAVLADFGGSADAFKKYFDQNLGHLLTWKVPNSYVIKYKGKELRQHSLGQRASALILFVLSQKNNDLVIIDQPEDDLDNQTIYNDVIKLIREIKPQVQFVFATHNANFPVLGDAEQVHACTYTAQTMNLASGSIDSPDIQQAIVDIMEGGEVAFNKRKEIYQIWKPQS